MGDVYVSVESLRDADTDSASSYVYQRVGEVCFAPAGACAPGAGDAGSCQVLAAAARHGITVYADGKGALAWRPGARCLETGISSGRLPAAGVHIARTSELVKAAVKSEEGRCALARRPRRARQSRGARRCPRIGALAGTSSL